MDLTKKIILSLVFLLFLPSILIADVLDDELPADTPVQVKEKARQVIGLGVENQGIIKMTQTMLRNGFSENQMIRAYEILGEARKNGLPDEPVMNKLYEGVGKRVQSGNIIMAMEKVKERYQVASQYAYRINSDSEQAGILTGHIAESLSAGMAGNDIDRIGEMFSRLESKNNKEKSSLEIQTFQTVKTMARMGAESSSVVDTVQTALQTGYDQNKMKSLEKAFVAQARARANPSAVAESFTRGMRAGVSVDELGRPGYMNSGSAMGGNGSGSGLGSINGAGSQGNMGGSMGSRSGSGGSGRSAGGGGGRGR